MMKIYFPGFFLDMVGGKIVPSVSVPLLGSMVSMSSYTHS